MRYGMSVLIAGLLTLGLCGAGHAAQSGFTEQKADGLSMELPSAWKVMPAEALAELQKRQPGGKMLLAAEGDVQNFPKLFVMTRQDPGAGANKFSDSEVKTWCDTLKDNLKKQLGDKYQELVCGKATTKAGVALAMEMTVPTGGPEMVSVTWTLPRGDNSLVATAMFPKTDEAKLLPLVKKSFESIQLSK